MKILLTGANGQLGLELRKQMSLLGQAYEIIATDYDTLDITNYEQVKSILQVQRPDVIINCAGYTAVDLCEEQVEKAYIVNALGPKHLGQVCNEIGAKLIHISTDYVFSGESSRALREDDPTSPINIYGKSKLAGDEYVKTFCKKHFIIRTAWLYGEGNNFVKTMLTLAQVKKEINVVGDQIGTPTSTKDLSRVIIKLMHTEYYGTYHATCEGMCSWYDFAVKIFELANINIKVNKVTSEDYISSAKRPKYSVLDNFMLKLYGLNTVRTWEDALIDYLEEEKKSGKI